MQKKYAIACHAAAQITMWVGSDYTALKRDSNVDNNDRIPGDWGYKKTYRRYPGVTLEMRTGNPHQLATLILAGEIDIDALIEVLQQSNQGASRT